MALRHRHTKLPDAGTDAAAVPAAEGECCTEQSSEASRSTAEVGCGRGFCSRGGCLAIGISTEPPLRFGRVSVLPALFFGEGFVSGGPDLTGSGPSDGPAAPAPTTTTPTSSGRPDSTRQPSVLSQRPLEPCPPHRRLPSPMSDIARSSEGVPTGGRSGRPPAAARSRDRGRPKFRPEIVSRGSELDEAWRCTDTALLTALALHCHFARSVLLPCECITSTVLAPVH